MQEEERLTYHVTSKPTPPFARDHSPSRLFLSAACHEPLVHLDTSLTSPPPPSLLNTAGEISGYTSLGEMEGGNVQGGAGGG